MISVQGCVNFFRRWRLHLREHWKAWTGLQAVPGTEQRPRTFSVPPREEERGHLVARSALPSDSAFRRWRKTCLHGR